MHWITIIVVGLAANLDNLGIGLSYGVKKTKIPFMSNLIIAILSMVVTYISVVAGDFASQYIPPYLANLLGSFLLCLIGMWTLISNQPIRSSSIENPEKVDWDHNNVISWKEAVYLGMALSLNCLASGIGMGANDISAIWATFSIGLFSLITIGIGSHFGYSLTKTFIGKYSTIVSGSLLILIGLYEIFA
ncbi:manganese efflux pump MntP family protein [Scopulibacillus cellulosilyticus]|uniref:Manganese efflux pump MntP family protein n=1 Tax=Scopulibacillus cellulosilyticus TaxID=2665665 RepID=A0ABW2Q379_9BACL